MQRIIRDSWLATLMIVIVTVGMATSTDGGGNATEPASAVLQKLLTSYDKKATPAELTGEPTEVNISVYVHSNRFDLKTQTASSVLYIRHSWIDKRLQFDGSNVARKMLYLLDGDCDKVWLPDTFIRDQVTPLTVDHRLLKIDPSGKAWYVRRVFITVKVVQSAYAFIVPFTFESFSYDTNSILLKPLHANVQHADELAPRSTIVRDCTTTYTAGTFPCLSCELDFARSDITQKQLYVCGSLTLLVAILSYTALWLSPSSTGGLVSRVLIGLVTSVLLFIIIRDGYSTEQVGTFIASDILIIGCVLVVVAAFVESVVVIVLGSTKSTESKKLDDSETAQCQWNDKQRKIDFVARIVVPIVVVVFGIPFLIVFHH